MAGTDRVVSRSPNGGMIVTGSAQSAVHRDLIVTLAARHKLPAVYVARFFVTDPVDDTSFGGFAGPKVVRFLKDVL